MGVNFPKMFYRMQALQNHRDFYMDSKIEGVGCSNLKRAQKTIVNAKIVRQSAYTEDSIPLKTADGYVTEMPIASMELQFGERKLKEKVAVMYMMEDDALIGSDLSIMD